MKLTYTKCGDYYIPNLVLPDTTEYHIGKYGRMRKRYLEEHRPSIYSGTVLSCKLWEKNVLIHSDLQIVTPKAAHVLYHYPSDFTCLNVNKHILLAVDTAVIMLSALLWNLKIKSDDKLMLILEGTGAITLMELYIVYRKCISFLRERGIEVVADHVGKMLTVQDAAGFQMSIARMADELERLERAKFSTAYFKQM